jgi:hypothetical protein
LQQTKRGTIKRTLVLFEQDIYLEKNICFAFQFFQVQAETSYLALSFFICKNKHKIKAIENEISMRKRKYSNVTDEKR